MSEVGQLIGFLSRLISQSILCVFQTVWDTCALYCFRKLSVNLVYCKLRQTLVSLEN